MRASLRWKRILLAGGLLLLPGTALAQSTTDPQPTAPPPQSNTVGPSELQNFTLSGSSSRPGNQQTTAPSAPAPLAATPPSENAPAAAPARRVAQGRQPLPQSAETPRPSRSKTTSVVQTPAPLPAPREPAQARALPAPVTRSASFSGGSIPVVPPDTSAHELKFSVLPWLLALLAAGAGILFFLWRRRPREAFAGGPEPDLFVPAEPPLAPLARPPEALEPAPSEPKSAQSARTGIISTRLRPQLELTVHPVRCAIDDERVVLEFELELFNAGSAPARSVIAESSLFNGGTEQDLAAFFANPVAEGERLEALPPMKRVTFSSEVVAPRSAVQEYELAGRKAIVPVLAFNALYQWSGGNAQTSAAYLVGRETKGEKVAPLALNGQVREFRTLAARLLPKSLRT